MLGLFNCCWTFLCIASLCSLILYCMPLNVIVKYFVYVVRIILKNLSNDTYELVCFQTFFKIWSIMTLMMSKMSPMIKCSFSLVDQNFKNICPKNTYNQGLKAPSSHGTLNLSSKHDSWQLITKHTHTQEISRFCFLGFTHTHSWTQKTTK